MDSKHARLALGLAGIASIVAFFLPFLDVGGLVSASGWSILVGDGVPWSLRLALLALPLGGLALVVTAASGHAKARWVGGLFGLGVYGYLGFQMVRLFLATTGIGLWITLAAAAVAVGAALFGGKRR